MIPLVLALFLEAVKVTYKVSKRYDKGYSDEEIMLDNLNGCCYDFIMFCPLQSSYGNLVKSDDILSPGDSVVKASSCLLLCDDLYHLRLTSKKFINTCIPLTLAQKRKPK